MNTMERKELEQAIADKLNELATLFGQWNGYTASNLCIGISDQYVWGYIYKAEGDYPFNFTLPRQYRNPGRIFTPELGEMIGKAAAESKHSDTSNPLCWASNEGVELMRSKLVFMLQGHDLISDMKEGAEG